MKRLCLDIKTKDIQTNDIIWGVLENDLECEQLYIECGTNDYDEKEIQKISDYIRKVKADIVITMNFCPSVSKACFDTGIPYASWIYDAPVQAIYHDEAKRDTNYFFVFDKYLLETARKLGLKNSFYLPLAANVTRMGTIDLTKEDEKKYSCDISFVGSCYNDDRFMIYRNLVPSAMQSEIDDSLQRISGQWDGMDRIHDSMSSELIAALEIVMHDNGVFLHDLTTQMYFEEGLMPLALAGSERHKMMEKLAGFSPRWYGSGAADKDKIPGVAYYPRLNYEEELPKAYYFSKINLSTTLHSITSGLSLRVFDIIGAGGFILTNYQPEAEELFEVGKELIVYHDFNELKELTDFYLRNERARLQVLSRGYKRLCGEYTYPIAVKKIMNTIFQ